MVAEILCVGTELLLGNITNTNARFMAEECAAAGVTCYYQTVVGDNPGRMREAMETALSRSDVVLVNGGLGPTEDDLTSEIAAEVFGETLVLDEAVYAHIDASAKRFHRSYPNLRVKNNFGTRKMSMVPEHAEILMNQNGQAPGIILKKDGKEMILLPGPPSELCPMFRNQVLPHLKGNSGHVLRSDTAKIVNSGESVVAEEIGDLISGQTNPTIATYAKTGEVHVRITACAADEKEARELLSPVARKLRRRFGDDLYTLDEEKTLEDVLTALLKKNRLSLATAESCTGGMIASRMVNVPGVSKVFRGGFVTYSNGEKIRALGVSEETLDKYGAVSAQTASEMAKGACRMTGATVGLSATGIAGPKGGTRKKPVGLVYLCCICGETEKGRELHLFGNRRKIRESAAQRALVLLRETILEESRREPDLSRKNG